MNARLLFVSLLLALLLPGPIALAAPPATDMTIFVGNSPGTFKQGDVGDSYLVTASNSGTKASTGTVTVVAQLKDHRPLTAGKFLQ